jgi:hypothetical protein
VEEFWVGLIQRRFARSDERTLFDQAFANTLRRSATPRPGLCCFYPWKLSEAKRLDDDKGLVAAVAEQLNISAASVRREASLVKLKLLYSAIREAGRSEGLLMSLKSSGCLN